MKNDELVEFSDSFLQLSVIGGTARAPVQEGNIMQQELLSEGTDLGRDLFANSPKHKIEINKNEFEDDSFERGSPEVKTEEKLRIP